MRFRPQRYSGAVQGSESFNDSDPCTQFVTAATAPANPTLDEPIRNIRMQLDGDLATVWAEYQLRIGGKVSHCGYDAFQLNRTTTGWKILNIADTFR